MTVTMRSLTASLAVTLFAAAQVTQLDRPEDLQL